jgi:1-acyl-sn-glycerol-3-phosphate acyltransferase
MLYRITRPIARIAFKVYFRKIYLINRENLPKDKPVILAANHPSAFLEPCILATILPRSLYFLARGDLFDKPFYAKMLYSWHIVPIFRFSDGYRKVRQNADTFDACYKALSERKAIMIMVEGSTEEVFRLRGPLKKGAARIAFGAIERHPRLDVQIVPLGVNFTNPNRFRSQAHFAIGQPILVSEYMDDYQENPQTAVRDLTEELENRLRPKMIHIEEERDEHLTKELMQMFRNGEKRFSWPVMSADSSPLAAQIEIAEHVNQMEEEEKREWEEQIADYSKLLEQDGLSDLGVAKYNAVNFSNTFILLIGFIPFLAGWLSNIIPVSIARYIVRTRVEQTEYIASVLIAASIALYIIYAFVLLIPGAFFLGWLVVPALLAVGGLGYFAVLYLDLFHKWKEALKVNRLPHEEKEALIRKREGLLI